MYNVPLEIIKSEYHWFRRKLPFYNKLFGGAFIYGQYCILSNVYVNVGLCRWAGVWDLNGWVHVTACVSLSRD